MNFKNKKKENNIKVKNCKVFKPEEKMKKGIYHTKKKIKWNKKKKKKYTKKN